MTTPSAMPSTVGFCLFSSLDDGMGYGCVEGVLDCWHQEGIENSQEILKVTGSSISPLFFAFGFFPQCRMLDCSWIVCLVFFPL